jgi:hypothetical protein
MRVSAPDRLAPLVAGLAGLAWFWFEVAPQRAGFEDTDNPATGLAFIAADKLAWPLGGLSLAILAFALIVLVIALRDRLEAAVPDDPGRAVRAVTVVGLLAATFLLGQAAVRLGGEPVRYVQSLSQAWGETAYLVTQFVGVQLFGVGGLALLSSWIVAVSWLSARRGVMPRPVAFLAVVPGFRLLAILGVLHILPDGLWLFFMASIPGTFLWLLLLGACLGATVARRATKLVPV